MTKGKKKGDGAAEDGPAGATIGRLLGGGLLVELLGEGLAGGHQDLGGALDGLEVGAGSLHGVGHYVPVVERQLEAPVDHLGHGPQAGLIGVGACGQCSDIGQDGKVGDRHHVHAGVAVRVAIGAELGQTSRGSNACLVAELACCGVIEGLVRPLETSR